MTDSSFNTGLTAWQRSSNHNRLIEKQGEQLHKGKSAGSVKLTYFGGSAFRITTPSGLTLMLDPWRNHPSRKWDWYFDDFPDTAVDIGISTHAHFDHDALHRLDASVLLDRLIGRYEFADCVVEGIADKHATDSSAALYDFRKIILEFDGVDITPPNNPRSWDNCLVIVETAGLRILHWGDNRHDPSQVVWDALDEIDIILLPIDNSNHVLSFESIDKIIEKVKPAVVVPHHYYIWDVVQRQSTLQPATDWLANHQQRLTKTNSASYHLDAASLKSDREKRGTQDWQVLYFGDHVGFDTAAWRQQG